MSHSLTLKFLLISQFVVYCSCPGMRRSFALRPDGPVRKLNLAVPRAHALYSHMKLLWATLCMLQSDIFFSLVMLHVYLLLLWEVCWSRGSVCSRHFDTHTARVATGMPCSTLSANKFRATVTWRRCSKLLPNWPSLASACSVHNWELFARFWSLFRRQTPRSHAGIRILSVVLVTVSFLFSRC